jgi:uncharacterized protein YcfL
MKKWIFVLLLCCGCASHKAKIVITRVNGEPSISLEFSETEKHTNREIDDEDR